MDFVEVNEHIAEWCVVNGYRIVESLKLKNRQIEIVDIGYGLLLRVRTESENDLDLLQEVLNGIGSAKINLFVRQLLLRILQNAKLKKRA